MPACHGTQKQQAAASPDTPMDAASALSVALQHPTLSSAPRNVCSLLQVCKSWRTAVQQSTAAQTCVDISVDRGQSGWEKLAAFAMWLPKYAGLAGSIAVEARCSPVGLRATDSIAASLVGLSFQQAATGLQSAAPWALRKFTGHGLVSPNLLSALPVAHLTALKVELPVESQQSCLAAVGCLTNLRSLRFKLGSCKSNSPGFLQHLSTLPKLTTLSLLDISGRSDFTTLPQSLQSVRLILTKGEAPVDLALGRLTCLTQLVLRCTPGPATPQELPSQLQLLHATSGACSVIHSFSIGALQHLRQLKLYYSRDVVDDYQLLAGHPQLQLVELIWPIPEQLTEAAGVWGTIPKLASFKVGECKLPASRLQTLAQHLSAATNLTMLNLSVSVCGGQAADAQGQSVCEHLTCLTNLKSLKTWCGGPSTHRTASSGIHHLTALTALTKLDVTGGLPVVDETNAILLALKLTNLEVLALGENGCNSGWSTAPLPVIAQLARLQHLSLGNLSEDNAKRGLSCLTAMTSLTHLGGFEAAGSDALTDFWATLNVVVV